MEDNRETFDTPSKPNHGWDYMHPELFTLPGGYTVKTYGFFMMLGFLTGVWLAMRRAERVKADPDVVLDLGFLCLLFGVGGARVFYVVHYWPQFANESNILLAIVDVTKGGLEFLGGFVGAFAAIAAYAWFKTRKGTLISVRMYLDILAPSAMWGLAFGRLGCYFNGCCFGSVCLAANAAQPAYPWAVQFPYGSPAFIAEWEERRVAVPAELIFAPQQSITPYLVPEMQLSMAVEKRERPIHNAEQAAEAYRQAKLEAPESAQTAALKESAERAKDEALKRGREILALRAAQQLPSRLNPGRNTSVSELQSLASGIVSLPVHPTQIYSSIHAFLLSGVLSAVFYVRKRHGIVIGVLLMLYPIPRLLLEMIRADNPGDVGGLTISQFISLLMVGAGAVWIFFIYKYLPERSPNAVPVKVEEDT